MRITRQTAQELVVEENSLWLFAVMLIAALLLAFLTLRQNQPKGLIAAGLFLIFALMWVRKTVFRFDAGDQKVHWTSRVLFKLTTGEIPFSQIKGIGTETSLGGKNSNVPTYRLTILTAAGPTPLSTVYDGNREKCMAIRTAILQFLQLDASVASAPETNSGVDEASVRSLLSQGRKIDAITLVRTEAKITLTQAVARVEEIENAMKAGK